MRERIDRLIVPNIQTESFNRIKNYSRNKRLEKMMQQRFFSNEMFENFLNNREAPYALGSIDELLKCEEKNEYFDEFDDEYFLSPELACECSEKLRLQCPTLRCNGEIQVFDGNKYLCSENLCGLKVFLPFFMEVEEFVRRVKRLYVQHNGICKFSPVVENQGYNLVLSCPACNYYCFA